MGNHTFSTPTRTKMINGKTTVLFFCMIIFQSVSTTHIRHSGVTGVLHGHLSGEPLEQVVNNAEYHTTHTTPLIEESVLRNLGDGYIGQGISWVLSSMTNGFFRLITITAACDVCNQPVPDGAQFYTDPEDYAVVYCINCGEEYNEKLPADSPDGDDELMYVSDYSEKNRRRRLIARLSGF